MKDSEVSARSVMSLSPLWFEVSTLRIGILNGPIIESSAGCYPFHASNRYSPCFLVVCEYVTLASPLDRWG